ncbi:MAG: hypothetical protein HY906_23390 [Deltaproteobacteria bacterium]|nr:hypothetical protein [Deltaproteobacteria bacterium]
MPAPDHRAAAARAGRDEDEVRLRAKARWYLDAGVEVVWLLLPETREVLVLTPAREWRRGRTERLPEVACLPGLAPPVDELFLQLGREV